MKIIITCPKKCFNEKEISELEQFETEFIESKSINLDEVESLYNINAEALSAIAIEESGWGKK
ncbi:MAG: hypothetical protein UT32_C0007G0001, partial [Parcubacteria group bacterium GW2011_GWC2_39_14]